MTTALSPVIASRLEKAAVDNGFDQGVPRLTAAGRAAVARSMGA